MDVELQQRAVEYLSLERRPDLARANVTPMPPWEREMPSRQARAKADKKRNRVRRTALRIMAFVRRA